MRASHAANERARRQGDVSRADGPPETAADSPATDGATPASGDASLLERLKLPGLLLAAGAHDALSAKLIEQAGFDVVWASGFGISAVHAVPDANILTLTETLEAVRRMVDGVRIPVIADCDNGYGNAINVMRTVGEFERAGAAGVCIEDNVFPKRCSFYSGVRRDLVPTDEHVRKIQAAKSAQRGNGFTVIARTEALIAGWGLEEALDRAEAYAAAGADAVLVHSKMSTFDELAEFARRWGGGCPLVCVPTTFPTVTADVLEGAGFRMAIFANQALRAAIAAMRETLGEMRRARSVVPVEGRIVPLEDVYDLVGVSELKANEQRFLAPGAEKARAVVIAAGFDAQLMPLVEDRPKSMLDVRGEGILERQLRALRGVGIDDIAVVRGYLKERIDLPGVRYYDNDRFHETGELVSLFQAEAEMEGRFVFLYGDIVFEPGILEKLLRAEGDVVVVVDRAWCDAYRARAPAPANPADLVITDPPPPGGYRFVPGEVRSRLRAIGPAIPPADAHGEFIGMAMFSAEGARSLRETYRRLQGQPRPDGRPALERAAFPDLLQEMADTGIAIDVVDIYKGWMEVDTFEDYRRAWAQIETL
jgi:phosphoenolpyruvate phosphomutase